MSGSSIAISSAVALIKSGAREWEWLLRQIESQDGWFRFPGFLADAIGNLNIGNYPLLYENEQAMSFIMLRAFMSGSEIEALAADMAAFPGEDLGEFMVSVGDDLWSELDVIEIPKTPKQREEAQKEFASLSEEARAAAVKAGQFFYMSLFAIFFQHLSLMVHGEKLTSLVAQAKAGSDDAFVKSVQIDRRILTVIPYFKARYERAQNEVARDFLDKLAYRMSRAPFVGKIRHKSLWMAFAVLDGLGLLDALTHGQILEICDDAGVGGNGNRIEDVKHLSKRLRQYREFQRRGLIATP